MVMSPRFDIYPNFGKEKTNKNIKKIEDFLMENNFINNSYECTCGFQKTIKVASKEQHDVCSPSYVCLRCGVVSTPSGQAFINELPSSIVDSHKNLISSTNLYNNQINFSTQIKNKFKDSRFIPINITEKIAPDKLFYQVSCFLNSGEDQVIIEYNTLEGELRDNGYDFLSVLNYYKPYHIARVSMRYFAEQMNIHIKNIIDDKWIVLGHYPSTKFVTYPIREDTMVGEHVINLLKKSECIYFNNVVNLH
jgi:hypothetical protein